MNSLKSKKTLLQLLIWLKQFQVHPHGIPIFSIIGLTYNDYYSFILDYDISIIYILGIGIHLLYKMI